MSEFIKGRIEKLDSRKAKSGRSFESFTVGGKKFCDFQHHTKIGDFKEGDLVSVRFEDGDFPKIEAMLKAEDDGNQANLNETKEPVKPRSESPASSCVYLQMKLAVELVATEQIQVDEKLARFETAYKKIRDLWNLTG